MGVIKEQLEQEILYASGTGQQVLWELVHDTVHIHLVCKGSFLPELVWPASQKYSCRCQKSYLMQRWVCAATFLSY